jgi:DNA-binding MarR family transcriptional regulator
MVPMGAAPDPVLASAGYLLLKAGTQFQGVIDEALAAVGLTGRQFLVLTHVDRDDTLSQQDLSRRLGLDPTIVVGLIDDLEGEGLVRRERDAADRRRYLLALTADGRRLQRRAAAAVGAAEAEFLGALDASERARLRALLERVMRSRLPWMAGVPAAPE